MVWGRGGEGKFFRVEGRVREHSCLPAQVSSLCACRLRGAVCGVCVRVDVEVPSAVSVRVDVQVPSAVSVCV